MAAISITSANVVAAAGSSLGTGTAGATITAGDVVYLNTSTSNYELGDADVEASSVVAGIALNGASASQPFDFIKSGTLTVGSVATQGLAYYLSPTAGQFDDSVPASSDYVVLLGIGLTSTTISINIHASGVLKP